MEREDEDDPVTGKRRVCAQVGGVVRFWQAEVERVGVPLPHPWGIPVFDKTNRAAAVKIQGKKNREQGNVQVHKNRKTTDCALAWFCHV